MIRVVVGMVQWSVLDAESFMDLPSVPHPCSLPLRWVVPVRFKHITAVQSLHPAGRIMSKK